MNAASRIPTKRRPAAHVGVVLFSVANAGYYALGGALDSGTSSVDVYRLSDAHHWSFDLPAKDWGTYGQLVYIDADEVWYHMWGGVARQRLDALGPGDP